MPVPGRTAEALRAVIRERIVESPEGCWLWQRSLNRQGYGWLTGGAVTKRRMAHSISYIVFVGDIPDGGEVHHTCENKACVNPEHLVVLDDAEHHAAHRPKTCSQGHDDWVYTNTKSGRYCRICSSNRSRERYQANKLARPPRSDSDSENSSAGGREGTG